MQTFKFGGHFNGDNPTLLSETTNRYGVGAFQFFLGEAKVYYPAIWEKDMVEQFQNDLDGLTKIIHLPYLFNFASTKKNIWNMSVRGLRSFIKQGVRLGVDYIVLHPGSYGDISDLPSGNIRLLQAMNKVVEEFGDSKLKVLLENSAGGGTTVGKLNNLVEVIQKLPQEHFGLCLDTAHLYGEGVSLDGMSADQIRKGIDVQPDVIHFNNPDPAVMLGSNLDRHHVGVCSGEGKYSQDTMKTIFEAYLDKILIVEGSRDYAADFVVMRKWCEALVVV